MHAFCDHIFGFFCCRSSSFCCVQERFKLKQSVLFWRTKTRSLGDGIPPALQSTPAFSCVCVRVVWLDFVQRSKIDQTFQPNTLVCAGSFPVWSVIGEFKREAVRIQTKPNTSVCELEKTCDFFFFLIWPSVWIRRCFRCVVFLFVWHSEHAEWDRVGEHRQPHWSRWQVAVLWPSVVSSSLSFLKSHYKQWNILYLKSLNVLFPQSKNN